MKRRKYSFIEYIDKTISGGVITQLLTFIGVIVVILALFIFIALIFETQMFAKDSEVGVVQSVIYHFFDAGNLHQTSDTPLWLQIFSIIVAFFGMVFLSGLLITTLSNIVERRVDSVERGLVVYKGIKNHYVIIGYGEITISLIKEIFGADYNKLLESDKKERKQIIKSFPRIILFTSQGVSKVRAEIGSQLHHDVEKLILIYSGDIESKEHLGKLNIHTAKEVYVLGDRSLTGYARDSKNLASIKQITNLRGSSNNGEKPTLTVNVQFDRMPSYSNIQKLSIPKEYIAYEGDLSECRAKNEVEDCQKCSSKKCCQSNLYFRPFNFFENWARLLWGYNSLKDVDGNRVYATLDSRPIEGDKRVHLVIVGFNRMGRALLLEALRLCHYANYDPNKPETKTKITVIDKELDTQLDTFKAQYPYIQTQIHDIEIEYINGFVESTTTKEGVNVRTMIDAAARDENTILTIAVCLKDPDLSLATGLSLPESVYFLNDKIVGDRKTIKENQITTNVIIRQELQSGLGEVLNQDNERFKNVKIFGMLTNGVSNELLDDRMAMFVNHNYELLQDGVALREQYLSGSLDINCLEAKSSWIGLSENMRWSNRYQVDMFATYLDILKRNGITEVHQIVTMNEELLEQLAEVEHRRWMAERSVSGWKQIEDNETRMDKFQHHDLIKPYNDLDGSEKEKDRTVIRNVIVLDKLFKNKENN